MRTIALMNQKGGVGKTTTTVNLGAALAEAGQRVLLIDLDPQAHLTINYGIEPSADIQSLYDVLVEEKPLPDAIHAVGERIGLVPSSIDLAAAEIELVSILGREQILKKRAEAANLPSKYDFVLLDCPPSLGLLTINALALANEVVIPMQPHFLALQGVAKLLETVQLVNRRMNTKLKVSGIVLTMFDGQAKLSNEVVAELEGFIESAKDKPLPWKDARIFATRIRRNIKLAESPSFGKPITIYDPASNGAADYRALAKEVIAMSAPVMSDPAPAAALKPAEKPVPVVKRAEPTAPAAKPIEKSAPVVKRPEPTPPIAKPVEKSTPIVKRTEPIAPVAKPVEKPKLVVEPIAATAPVAKPAAVPAAPRTTAQPGISVAINRALEPSNLKASKVAEDPAPSAPANSSEVAALNS
jgi:chromosome partitioning protein